MTVQVKVPATKKRENASAKTAGKAVTAHLSHALVNVQVKDFVSKAAVCVRMASMATTAVRRTVRTTATVTATAKTALAFVTMASLGTYVSTFHARTNADSKANARVMVLANATKAILTVIVPLPTV